MFFSEFSYQEYSSTDMHWKLEKFKLNDLNLIVGSNAAGKTRTLNVIAGLGKIMHAPQLSVQNGTYFASMKDGGKSYQYHINTILVRSDLINLKVSTF